MILSYTIGWGDGLAVNSMRVVLGLCGAKMGRNSKARRNDIELSILHHSIRLDELIILMCSNVKIG